MSRVVSQLAHNVAQVFADFPDLDLFLIWENPEIAHFCQFPGFGEKWRKWPFWGISRKPRNPQFQNGPQKWSELCVTFRLLSPIKSGR